MKIDFHIHTKYSIDSLSEPRRIIQICRKGGIIPAIADHNNMRAHADFRSIDRRFKFIPAEEISTNKGDLIGLFLNEPIHRKTPFMDAIDAIKSQGGLSYLPHMFDVTRGGVANETLAEEVDIIETFNGRAVLGNANKRADEFATIAKKPKAAGSDAHFTMELGKTFTEISGCGSDCDSDCELEPRPLLRALKRSRLHCHYSPIYLKGITYAIVAYKKMFGRM